MLRLSPVEPNVEREIVIAVEISQRYEHNARTHTQSFTNIHLRRCRGQFCNGKSLGYRFQAISNGSELAFRQRSLLICVASVHVVACVVAHKTAWHRASITRRRQNINNLISLYCSVASLPLRPLSALHTNEPDSDDIRQIVFVESDTETACKVLA